jgi:hypothetical protein
MNYHQHVSGRIATAIFALVGAAVFMTMAAVDGQAQRRDYMTEDEIEIVRDAQEIDLRIDVLTKMIDRRFSLLGLDVGGWKPKNKNPRWGDEPVGTSFQLFDDINKLLQKAVDDIDMIVQRNELAIAENKMEGKLFPKAIRMLDAASKRYLPILKTASEKAENGPHLGAILGSIELCEEIIEAAAKLPTPAKK